MHATAQIDTLNNAMTDDLAAAREVLRIERDGLNSLSEILDHTFTQAIDLIQDLKGRVIVTGMGKSGHVGRKMAAIFASTGTPSFFVHPGEASHGDMGMITRQDCVIAISNGGEAPELKNVLTYCKLFRIPLIAITAKPQSSLALQADILLQLPAAPEACPLQKAPTTSALMTMALGDALAVALMKRRNFSPDEYKHFHPGGSLGGKLIKVETVMRQDSLPLVQPDTPIAGVITVMSQPQEFGFWGCAVIVDAAQNLLGYFSDGDIRRHIATPDLLHQPVSALMHANPFSVDVNAMAASALVLMNDKRITQLIVQDGTRVRGLIRLHDILAAGITV